MFVIEYLGAIVTRFGSFATEEDGLKWLEKHQPNAPKRAYRIIEIPLNSELSLTVKASNRRNAPAVKYVRAGSETLEVKKRLSTLAPPS